MNEYHRKKQVLLSLVYKLNVFTTDELVKKFVEAEGNSAIDANLTIVGYLNLLVRVGILRQQGGVYAVA